MWNSWRGDSNSFLNHLFGDTIYLRNGEEPVILLSVKFRAVSMWLWIIPAWLKSQGPFWQLRIVRRQKLFSPGTPGMQGSWRKKSIAESVCQWHPRGISGSVVETRFGSCVQADGINAERLKRRVQTMAFIYCVCLVLYKWQRKTKKTSLQRTASNERFEWKIFWLFDKGRERVAAYCKQHHRRKVNQKIYFFPFLFLRVFGGLIMDIKRKAPFFWSDFRDAFSLQCLASFLFLYCACMSPVITFGGLLGEATEGRIVCVLL